MLLMRGGWGIPVLVVRIEGKEFAPDSFCKMDCEKGIRIGEPTAGDQHRDGNYDEDR
jgi:hypothetical protein